MTTSYQKYIDAEKLPVSFKVLIPKSGFLMPINQYGPITRPTYITREQYKKLIAYGIPVELVLDEPVVPVVEVKVQVVEQPKPVEITVNAVVTTPVVVEEEHVIETIVVEEPVTVPVDEQTVEVVENVVVAGNAYTNDILNAKQTSELLAILKNEYGIESEAKVPKRADIIKRILKLQESK